jgi:hypothetical protein
LIPEVERLANIKYALGRLQENGHLLLSTIDLLRYGFSRSRKLDTKMAGPTWRTAAE